METKHKLAEQLQSSTMLHSCSGATLELPSVIPEQNLSILPKTPISSLRLHDCHHSINCQKVHGSHLVYPDDSAVVDLSLVHNHIGH